jgi:DNA modification methylase
MDPEPIASHVAASPSGLPRRRSRANARDRIVELRRVRAGELKENPSNWRRHPERQRAALRSLLAEIGYAAALIARPEGEHLVLIDGHLRQSLDPDQVVPVLVVDLSEDEAATLLATLDPLAAMAEPDAVALASLLERVRTSSAAVTELLDSLRRQAGLPVLRVLADPEAVPPLPAKPKTRRGELHEVAGQRLLCGDATSAQDMARLMGTDRADVVWTDPPYGVDYVGKTKRALTIANDRRSGSDDLLERSFAALEGALAPGARLYVCHPAGPASLGFLQAFCARWHLRQTLVWVKDSMVLGHSDYHYRHEPILYGTSPGEGRKGRGASGWYGGNAETSVFEVPRPKASREHPTVKPVELISRCLRNSSGHGQVVVDPFAGSGSTLVASALLGRRGFGMELDPAYCDVTLRRLKEVTGEAPRRVDNGAP